MSWIDRVNNGMIIKTGDGKEYSPLWRYPTEEVQYNVSSFEFVNKRGTLVYRGEDKGSVYNLEFYFQGEDNIDQGQAFKISARDSRPWEISHPLYDTIIVQPARIQIDNSQMNVTKIVAQVMETITDKLPSISTSAQDKIITDQEALGETISEQMTAEDLEETDVTTLTEENTALYEEGKKKVKAIDSDAYYDKFKQANAAVVQLTSAPLNAMRKIQTFINAPALYQQSVNNRLAILTDQFNNLVAKITTLVTRKDKAIHESLGASIVSAMVLSTVTDPQYSSSSDVLSATSKLTSNYNTYLSGLDGLQTANAGLTTSYIPNPEIVGGLSDLVKFTVAHLKEIALNQRTEHSIVLEEDSNAILCTHRFYGMDNEDVNLDEFINTNQLGINQMLQIRKGTSVIYYV